MAGIASIQLDRLRQRLAERELSLTLSDKAMQELVSVGYDPVFGARPLKRAIVQQIENPLAHKLLTGDFLVGDSILVDFKNGQFVFERLKFN